MDSSRTGSVEALPNANVEGRPGSLLPRVVGDDSILQRVAQALIRRLRSPFTRVRPRRRRRSETLAVHCARLLFKLSVGFLLVGCQSAPINVRGWSNLGASFATLRENDDAQERLEAYRTLAQAQGISVRDRGIALELLEIGAERETSEYVRAEAVRALGSIGDPRSLGRLEAAAADPSPIVRTEAIQALRRMEFAGALPILAELATQDVDPDVRVTATRMIAEMKGPESQAALVDCLSDPELAVAHTAAEALREGTGKDFGADPEMWASYLRDESAAVEEPPTRMAGAGRFFGTFR